MSRISIGDKVTLNSGGPEMLVVDLDWGKVVAAYIHNGQTIEVTYRAACLSPTADCSRD